MCATSLKLNGQVLDVMAAEGPGRAFAFAGSLDATLRTGDPDGVKAAVRSLGQAARARGVFAGRLCGGGIDSFGVSFCFFLLCALGIRKIVMVACSTCGLDSVLYCSVLRALHDRILKVDTESPPSCMSQTFHSAQIPDIAATADDMLAAMESGYTLIGVASMSSDLPFAGARHLAAPFWEACKRYESA
jgi:hypothetical protein